MAKSSLIAFFFLVSIRSAFGQAFLLTPESQSSDDVSQSLSQFVDSTARLTLAEVRGKAFRPVESSNFRISFSDDAYWYRCTLRNESPGRERWVLKWDNPVTENLQCYIRDADDSLRIEEAGIMISREAIHYQGRVPYFLLEIPYGQERTVYFRLKNQRGMRSVVSVTSAEIFAEQINREFQQYGFFTGLVSLRLFFVLVLAIFVIKETAFRAYCLMLVIRSLGYWGLQSKFGDFFTDQPALATTLNFLSYHIVPIGYMVVMWAFFSKYRDHTWFRTKILVTIAATLLLGVAIAADYRWYWLLSSTWLVVGSQLFIFGMYALAIAKRERIDWYYSTPFLLGVGSYFVLETSLLGLFSAPWVFEVALSMFVAEIFVFVIFLGKIILNYEKSRTESEQQLQFNVAQTARLKEIDELKSDFFANISHEFRTPLTLLVGPLNDLSQKYPQEKFIPMMQRHVGRLRSLIDQLLDLSRMEARQWQARPERGDLGAYIQQLCASFASLARQRGIRFDCPQDTSCETDFDPDIIEKIVTNLLSNAFKFTPKGGTVSVNVSVLNQELVLAVADSGHGIAPAHLPYIFDRFYRGDASYKGLEGTGIGLSLVHQMVGLLHGRIEVTSKPNLGSTFTVRLPVALATEIETKAPGSKPIRHSSVNDPMLLQEKPTQVFNGSQEDAAADHPLLLLVEDNADLRAYLSGIFADGYQIDEAIDGQQALEKAFEATPDLVICDLMMPRLDGLEFCRIMKSDVRTSHIPIIMLTARAGPEDRLTGLSLGADDYLTKPFSRSELEIRVQNLLRQRVLLRKKYSALLHTPLANARPQPLGNAVILNEGVGAVDEKFLHRAMTLVKENIGDSGFSVEQFCQTMDISRSQMHRKLKALTDQSATEFIRVIRIYRAAELLSTRRKTVSEVAYAVGFESLSYFSSSFQKQMGTAPSDWASNTISS